MAKVTSVKQVERLEPLYDIGVGVNHNFFADGVLVHNCHRWNKTQQDVLLPAVENGTIKFIGATTEKPQFAVNSTLLSRLMVFELKPLTSKDMVAVIARIQKHYADKKIGVSFSDSDAIKTLINRCSGDARKLTTVMEMIIEAMADGNPINEEMVVAAIPSKHIYFDANGNDHFDLAHCYQEAIQHSEGNDAVFWLAKWVASGEDPLFICRRMLITAFEDCADNPHALIAVTAAFEVTKETGLPECLIPMGTATVIMAQSRRNKTGYYAIKDAMDDVNNGVTVHVPPELRAGTSGYVRLINKEYIRSRITQLEDGIIRDELETAGAD